MRALEECADLYFRELVSTTLSRTYASFFVPFIADVFVHQLYMVTLSEWDDVSIKQKWITIQDDAFNAWKQNRKEDHSTIDFGELYCLEKMTYWERSVELVESRPMMYRAKQQ